MIVRAVGINDDKPISSFIYLHGTLEDINEFDLCRVEGLELPPKEEDYGIHDVTVILPKLTCLGKLFLWKRGSAWEGLVVSVNDLEYMADAQAKFDRREEDI